MSNVEIANFRSSERGGALKGYFTLIINPLGIQINDCKLFEKDGQKWFNFPAKEVKSKDSDKINYFPLVNIMHEEYRETLRKQVIEAIEKRDTNGTKSKAPANAPVKVHAQPSPDLEDYPF